MKELLPLEVAVNKEEALVLRFAWSLPRILPVVRFGYIYFAGPAASTNGLRCKVFFIKTVCSVEESYTNYNRMGEVGCVDHHTKAVPGPSRSMAST